MSINELQISVSTIFGKDPALQHNFGQLKTCSGAKYRYKAYFTWLRNRSERLGPCRLEGEYCNLFWEWSSPISPRPDFLHVWMNTKRNNSILNLGHSGHLHKASVVERHPQCGHLSLPFLRFRCQSTHRMRMLPVGLKTIARPFSCPPGFTWSQASMPWFKTPSRSA